MSLENEIIGVDHLGILTGDLKRDVAWYEEKLGFEKIQQRIVVMNGRTEIALLKKRKSGIRNGVTGRKTERGGCTSEQWKMGSFCHGGAGA